MIKKVKMGKSTTKWLKRKFSSSRLTPLSEIVVSTLASSSMKKNGTNTMDYIKINVLCKCKSNKILYKCFNLYFRKWNLMHIYIICSSLA